MTEKHFDGEKALAEWEAENIQTADGDWICEDKDAVIRNQCRTIAAMWAALKEAADWIKNLDGGDMRTETGWKSDELLSVWMNAQAAIERAEGSIAFTTPKGNWNPDDWKDAAPQAFPTPDREGDSRKELEECRAEATRLAVCIAEQHFDDRSPEWKPCGDLMGVIFQISNMVAGLERRPNASEN